MTYDEFFAKLKSHLESKKVAVSSIDYSGSTETQNVNFGFGNSQTIMNPICFPIENEVTVTFRYLGDNKNFLDLLLSLSEDISK